MTIGNNRERAFRQLLVREAGSGAGAPTIAAVLGRLGERLTQQLAPLIGDAGVRAIYDRSFHLMQSKFPGLTAGRNSDPRAGPFTVAQLSLEHLEPAVAADAAVALLIIVGELLAAFIGESLTANVLRGAWPGDFPAATAQETAPHE